MNTRRGSSRTAFNTWVKTSTAISGIARHEDDPHSEPGDAYVASVEQRGTARSVIESSLVPDEFANRIAGGRWQYGAGKDRSTDDADREEGASVRSR